MNRRSLEREADRLGIPWSADSIDADLQAAIENRSKDPEPTYSDQPTCYGLYWNSDRDKDCKACAVKAGCGHRFALVHLPQVRQEMGTEATLGEVSKKTKVMPDAIMDAIAYEKAHRAQKPDESADLSKAFDPGDPNDSDEDDELLSAEEVEKALQQESKADANDAVMSLEGQKIEGGPSEVEVVGPSEELVVAPQKPTKKKAKAKKKAKVKAKMSPKKKKAPAKKKAKRKARPRRVDRPRRAGSAQRASDPVTTQMKLSTESVQNATALAAETRTWGDDKKRWEKERARSTAIASLPRGSTIVREYNSQTHRVKVLLYEYKYLNTGKSYPTLYAVTKAITGVYEREAQRKTAGKEKSRPQGVRKQSNWSAPKFWRVALNQALYDKTPKKISTR